MSVVILGGNECMVHRYKELCQAYRCRVKIFTQPVGNLKRKIGSPDLIVFFTGAMSHKMVHGAVSEMKGTTARIARCRTSSVAALKEVLEMHAGSDEGCRQKN